MTANGLPRRTTGEYQRIDAAHHLHAFVREARPSVEEWERGIEFLTAVGQACTDTRQEFVLLSDVLGVSMLVETLNEQEGGTESTVLGPFHMVESPPRELGDSIDLVGEAEPCVVSGRVLSTDGTPLPNAEVDVWQCDENGFYDVQRPDSQPPGNGRPLSRMRARLSLSRRAGGADRSRRDRGGEALAPPHRRLCRRGAGAKRAQGFR